MRFATVTFGCRVNLADTLRVEERLRAAGAEPVPVEQADFVFVNTCSVTASADQGARQTIRRIARLNPSARIVAAGCYATRRPDEMATLPGVIRIVPNDRKDDLDWFDVGRPPTTAERFGAGEGACGAPLTPGAAGRTVFTLRVQTGCEERCSYCIIPSTRGRGVSLPADDVVARSGRAEAAGFQEIVLAGVHLGSYGCDLAPRTDLVALLRRLDAARSGVRLRISSLEPMNCSQDLIDLAARSGRVAPHFHLPLQHASDRVLSAMRRPYTLAGYRSVVDRIRDLIPHAAIGSDVIVGFPGETDEDFQILCSYLETSPLTSLHVFPYSDRPGTAASALPGKVAAPVVRERAASVRAIGRRLSDRFKRTQVGLTHRALTLDDGSVALTGNYLKVRIPDGQPRNVWVDVRVTEAGEVLRGQVAGVSSATPPSSAPETSSRPRR